jgi:hypothetical protein
MINVLSVDNSHAWCSQTNFFTLVALKVKKIFRLLKFLTDGNRKLLKVFRYNFELKKTTNTSGFAKMPKFAIPNMAWKGYFTDTEDNIFGIHQPDENAR